MKRNLAIIILLLFFYFDLSSQNIEIKGIVIDSVSKISIPYSNILIKNQKDSMLYGVLSNENGEFRLKNIVFQKGLYIVISNLGYIDKKTPIIILKNSSKINLDTILLSWNIYEISEIVITDKHNSVEHKFDRTVYNISENKKATALSIIDLLKTLPGIIISETGEVKYKGAPAIFYIDNQPLQLLYPKIEMIPIDNIQKIELIDGSSRGIGSGKGGIINIKMKKVISDGFSGLYSTKYNTVNFDNTNNINGFLNTNYKKKKIIIFSNINNDYLEGFSCKITNGVLNYNNVRYNIYERSLKKFTNNNLNYQAGIVIQPSDKTKIVLSGFGVYNYYDNHIFFEHNKSINSETLYDKYNSNTLSNPYQLLSSFSTFFTHEFDSLGTELSCGFGYDDFNSQSDELIKYKYEYISHFNLASTLDVKKKYSEDYNLFFGNIFFNHQLKQKIRWNGGWTGWFFVDRDINESFLFNDVENKPSEKVSNSNEQEHLFFLRIGAELKKWKFDCGISMQYDKYFAYNKRFYNNIDTLFIVDKSFVNFLPSLTIAYLIDNKSIKFTFDRSVMIPYQEQFIDFINKQDTLNWSNGNPDIKTVNYNNFYLGFSIDNDNWNFSSDLFYSLTNNEIKKITYPYSQSITLTIPENIGKTNSFGVDLSFWASLQEIIEFNLSSSIYYTMINANNLYNKTTSLQIVEDNLKKEMFGFNINFSSNIIFNSNTTASISLFYYSKDITYTGYNYNYLNSSLSFSKKLFNKKLSITLGINSILDDLISTGSYLNYAGYNQNTIDLSSKNKRSFTLRIQYTFRKGDRGTNNIRTR